MLMASVFKYDSYASCINIYPQACIQKGTDLLDVIPRTYTGLTVGFNADVGTL
jgi:hypothetical protein